MKAKGASTKDFSLCQTEVKEMKSREQTTERRKLKRRKCHRRPIAILGPDPVKVGNVTTISDDAAEIQFLERDGSEAFSFSELAILIPDYNSPFLSGKVHIETVSCSLVENAPSRFQSPMQKCIVSLTNMNSTQKRLLKGACL